MPRDKVDVAKGVADAYNRRDRDGSFAEFATPDFGWYPGMVRAATARMGLGAPPVEPPAAWPG